MIQLDPSVRLDDVATRAELRALESRHDRELAKLRTDVVRLEMHALRVTLWGWSIAIHAVLIAVVLLLR